MLRDLKSHPDASQPARIAELWILSFYTLLYVVSVFFFSFAEGCCELYGAPGIVSVVSVVVVSVAVVAWVLL